MFSGFRGFAVFRANPFETQAFGFTGVFFLISVFVGFCCVFVVFWFWCLFFVLVSGLRRFTGQASEAWLVYGLRLPPLGDVALDCLSWISVLLMDLRCA